MNKHFFFSFNTLFHIDFELFIIGYYYFIRYTRKDALALGKLCLNLSNFNQVGTPQESYTRSLYGLIERLATKAHFLPMSLNNMNTLRLIPKKDYQENRLISGQLQLSSHTHLVIDETAMTEGKN